MNAVRRIPVSTNQEFLTHIALLKAKKKLKLSDAVIAHSAIDNKAVLITNDSRFNNIEGLAVKSFNI